MRILLIGGSKSGKSSLGQKLAATLCEKHYYWATMEPTDGEDRHRIAMHLLDRDGMGFETVECGKNLPAALPSVDPNSAVLFDSITACLANEMFGATMDENAAVRVADEILQISRHPKHFVCVCDNLWFDAIEYDEWTDCYRRGLAEICRSLAKEFDTVCEVTATMPHIWKGALPE